MRYGEPWRDLAGDNLFYWMLVEVARLREENRQLKGGPFVALSFEEAIAILPLQIIKQKTRWWTRSYLS